MLLREAILDFIRQYPVLFFRVLTLKKKYKTLLVSKDTDIMIEGYPRSANTFAVAAFSIAQNKPLKIARHTHAVAQLKRAAALKIPALVIIREPEQAILSYVIREDNVTLSLAINRYISYYKTVNKLHNSFIIAEFDDIVNNYGDVIAKINKRFNTHFSLFEHTKDNIDKTFQKVESMEREHASGELSESKVGRPSKERSHEKARLAKQLDKTQYINQLHECKTLFKKLTKATRRQISSL